MPFPTRKATLAVAAALCLAFPLALAMMPKEASATLSSRGIELGCEGAVNVQMAIWKHKVCNADEECTREARESFYEECTQHARECKSNGASSCTWRAPDVEWEFW